MQGRHQVAQKFIITSFPLYCFKLISFLEKSSNISEEIGFGISFKAKLLSGTSSFACDIDEKILKQNKKVRNFVNCWFVNIRNKNLTHEK